jgi:hypothetical protein
VETSVSLCLTRTIVPAITRVHEARLLPELGARRQHTKRTTVRVSTFSLQQRAHPECQWLHCVQRVLAQRTIKPRFDFQWK